ncbi:hypothetical protein [Streptomyces sp. DG1A-41]|uniref:hypothetical protein n=1 Tax=Streptomyces sp. DG1A-41 TaxID=3125779 RepID=UPI0030CF086C
MSCRTPLGRIVAGLDCWRARPHSAAETRAAHAVIADAATPGMGRDPVDAESPRRTTGRRCP